MQISFRQGVVRAPTGFLALGTGTVNLVIPPDDSAMFAIADLDSDYLISERSSITSAWAGPFLAATNYWLYIDINLVTGVRTFGHTLVSPVAQSSAPLTPANDQHWFDTASNSMKVYVTVAGRFVEKVRVFVAKLDQGTVFVSMSASAPAFTGTQVGAAVATRAGALIFDQFGKPLKKSTRTFLTTEDATSTTIGSGSQVKIGSIFVAAEAAATLAAYTVVRFTAFNKISAASNYLVDNGAYGIIDRALTLGEVGNVIAEGVVENAAWDWSAAGVNAPLYVDGSGVLTTVKPTIPTIVAAVIDRTKILIRPSSLFADSSSDPATTTVAGVVTLSVAPVSATIPIAVGNNDTRLTNARAPTAHTHPTTDILPGTLSGMALQTFSEVTTAPLITAGALVLNIAGGNIFNVALNANVTTLTFSGVPVAHTTLITLALTADGTPRVVTWPASVKWPLGIAPTLTSAAGKIDILTFVTFNQGVSWLAAVAGQGY